MKRITEKIERRVGQKLGLKAERCLSPKCAHTRRPSPPGMHGMSRSRRRLTERGMQMLEKKKIAALYGVSARRLKSIFIEARRQSRAQGTHRNVVDIVVEMLERRLDSVVWRLGLAPSRLVARQLVSHGHVTVNGRRVDIPSFFVPVGAVVSFRPGSLERVFLKSLERTLPKYQPPSWLKLDAKNFSGTVAARPNHSDIQIPADVPKVAELYARS